MIWLHEEKSHVIARLILISVARLYRLMLLNTDNTFSACGGHVPRLKSEVKSTAVPPFGGKIMPECSGMGVSLSNPLTSLSNFLSSYERQPLDDVVRHVKPLSEGWSFYLRIKQ